MHILQYIALTVILTAMLLSGCSRSPNTFDAQPTMDAIVTEVTSEDTALAAYASLLAGTETPVNSGQWWIPDFQEENMTYEYTHLDLDGDGVPELLVQLENDPIGYSGVFHYDGGKIFCWNSDAADGSCWDSPLSDGTMVRTHYWNGTRSYKGFRYRPDGSKETVFFLFAREERIPEDSTEPCPYYGVDNRETNQATEVDQATFEQRLAELVTNRALSPSVWTTV